MEVGGAVTEDTASFPVFLKYGVARHHEVEVGFDAVRLVQTPSGVVTSQGDVFVGFRSHLADLRGGSSMAVMGRVKLPTALDGAGTGEVDATVAGIASISLGRLGLDVNAWFSALGQPDGGMRGRAQAIATLNVLGRGCCSFFAEVAQQKTAGLGSGGLFDAGVTFASSRRTFLDASVGVGWHDGYPDRQLTVGWTILIDRIH